HSGHLIFSSLILNRILWVRELRHLEKLRKRLQSSCSRAARRREGDKSVLGRKQRGDTKRHTGEKPAILLLWSSPRYGAHVGVQVVRAGEAEVHRLLNREVDVLALTLSLLLEDGGHCRCSGVSPCHLLSLFQGMAQRFTLM